MTARKAFGGNPYVGKSHIRFDVAATKKIIVGFLFALNALVAVAYETVERNGCRWRYDVEGRGDIAFVSIVGVSFVGDGFSGEVDVPDEINGMPVRTIRLAAFNAARSVMTSLRIPDSVQCIERFAFSDKQNLRTVWIGAGVTNIGKKAFAECPNLNTVTINSSTVTIGEDCFLYTYRITNLTVHGHVEIKTVFKSSHSSIGRLKLLGDTKTICDDFFSSGRNLKDVILPNSVERIGKSAFRNCPCLTNVVLGTKIVSVGANAFEQCIGLKSIKLPDGVKEIGESCFKDCTNLNEVQIPSGVKAISAYAFQGCAGMTNVIMTQGVEEIAKGAFSGCRLTSLVLPDTVKTLGNGAFVNNPLVSVRLSTSLNDCGEDVFGGCSNIVSVSAPYQITSIPTFFPGSVDAISSVEMIGTPQSVPPAYFAGLRRLSHVSLPDGIVAVGDGAFEGCPSLCHVSLPPSVLNIGAKAFYGCKGLTEIELPPEMNSIGDYCFAYCTGLKAITIPDAVECLGEGAFDGCLSLSDVRLPNRIEALPKFLFRRCSKIVDLNIPDTVRTIGYASLLRCALKVLRLPSKLECIEKYSIADNYFEEVRIPASVTNIGYRAFGGCKNIVSVEIPPSVGSISNVFPQSFSNISTVSLIGDWKSIKKEMFMGCVALPHVDIPSSVSSIGNGAFKLCVSLSEITIPNKVTVIPEEMCYGCESLTNVIIKGAVKKFVRRCFANCQKLESITIPSTTKTLYADSFANCTSLKAVQISDLAKWCAISFNNTAANPLKCGRNLFLNGKLVNNLEIPQGVTRITGNAFYNCLSIQSVSFPHGVTNIGVNAFKGCANLKRVTVPDVNVLCGIDFANELANPLAIAHDLYVGSNKIESVTLSRPVGRFAFCGSSIKEVTLQEGVTSIGGGAFYNCRQLQRAYLDWMPRSDDDQCFVWSNFYGCDNLFEIKLWHGIESLAPAICSNLTHVIISSKTKELTARQFAGCPRLKSVTFEKDSSVTNINDEAFYGCAELTSMNLPDSVCRIGKKAFSECKALADLHLGLGLVSVEENAFGGCNLLERYRTNGLLVVDGCILSANSNAKELVIPDGIRLMAEKAFRGEQPFTSVVMPRSLKYVGKEAFGICTNVDTIVSSIGTEDGFVGLFMLSKIKRLKFLEGAKRFDKYGNYPNLEVLELPNGITSLKTYSFAGATNLTSITVPPFIAESYDSRGVDMRRMQDMFPYSYSSLTNIVIGEGASYIGRSAFYGCSRVRTLTIPSTVRYIESETGLGGLQRVTFAKPSMLHTIGKGALSGRGTYSTGGQTIRIPASVMWIERRALLGWGKVIFEGNAPSSVGEEAFAVRDLLQELRPTIYVKRSSTGWGVDIPGVWHGCSIAYDDSGYVDLSPDQTGGMQLSVDESWVSSELAGRYGEQVSQRFTERFGDDLGVALLMPSGKKNAKGDPMYVWEDFVMGTDPTDPGSEFLSQIKLVNGKPVVTWTPDLNEGGLKSVRNYRIYGCEQMGGDWKDMRTVSDVDKSKYHFFKVLVEMP